MEPKHSMHCVEIEAGERFEFGANWQSFLDSLDDDRIIEAENSLKGLLHVSSLEGKRFLDIGCGSGLFSLCARRLGASVYSFDFDPKSVSCATELKRRFFLDDDQWVIAEGSVLDKAFLDSLGKFDIVYSWGVLHHTGDLNAAMESAALRVDDHGLLCIALYNDEGAASKFWRSVKKLYCRGIMFRYLVICLFFPIFAVWAVLKGLINHRDPIGHFRFYKRHRGMSIVHDWYDWLGGFPFEVAKVEDIFCFFRDRSFGLQNLITTNSFGCNQFVFRKDV